MTYRDPLSFGSVQSQTYKSVPICGRLKMNEFTAKERLSAPGSRGLPFSIGNPGRTRAGVMV